MRKSNTELEVKVKDPYLTTRRAYIAEAALEYFFFLMTNGSILVFLLQRFNLSDSLMGVLANVSSIGFIMQLFAMVYRRKKVKKMVIWVHFINQLAFTLLYLMPFYQGPTGLRTVILVVLLFLGYFLTSAMFPIKISWLTRSVPDNERGVFTGKREMVSIFGGIFITLGVGAFADFAEASGKEDLYFIVCFAGMIVLLLLHTLSLILCKEDATEEEPEKIALGQKIKAFVKDPKIRKILPVTAMYFFGNGFAYTFMFSYWLTELKFSMVMVTVITIIASVARVLVTPAFGRLGDRRSFAYSTSIGALLTAIAYTINIFAYPGPMRWITVVFASIQFLAMTAITSGGINIVYDHVKTEDCGAVYGISQALCGIVSIFASMLGGWVLALVQNAGGLNLFGITIYGQQVLSFISAILLFGMFFYLKIFVCRMKTNKNEEKEYALEDELGL